MKNRILFNGLLYAPDGTGISRYAEYLAKELLKNAYDVDIVLRKDYIPQFNNYDNVIFCGKKISNSTHRIIAEQWELRKLYEQYELIHFPDYASPIFTTTPSISTIHDLSMITMKKLRTNKQNLVKNVLLKNTILRTSGIICDSNFTRNELLNFQPKLENKSSVIHLGVCKPCNVKIKMSYLDKLGVDYKKYFLYVGTLAPHKNIVNLIKGFAILCNKGFDGKLIIAGGKGWLFNEIFEIVETLGLGNRIIFTGYVAEEELEALYYGAFCLINVSLYEGFGLPPLEAMIRRIPVVVSNIPVFHETVENCGLYCNPQAPESIATQLQLILDNKDERERLIEDGENRAREFTWEKMAKETNDFYQTILNGGE